MYKSARGMGGMMAVATVMLLAAGGAGRVSGQVGRADTALVFGVHPRYLQRVCEASMALMRADDAVKAAIAEDDSLTKANAKALSAVPVALRRPMRDASREFDALFDAFDDLDAAWGSVVLDFTGGKADLRLPLERDTVPDALKHDSKDPALQHQREARAGQADMFGVRIYVGFEEAVRERCPALKDGAPK